MAKKKGLFTQLRRIFISEANPEKKERRRRWTFWKLRVKKRLPSIIAPPPDRTGSEAHEEQNQNIVTVVAEVKQLSCSSPIDINEKFEDDSASKRENTISDTLPEDQIVKNREIEGFAAVRIQTAFRGYLARKALRALKGIVKLQAYIRGRAVRRQAMTTLKCLQSVVNIQSQVCAKRTQIPGSGLKHYEESKEFQTFKDNMIKVETNGQKRWDDSLMTKEEAEAFVMSKKEAALRRERIREYAVTHRKSAESYQAKNSNTRWKYWLDQWVDTQLTKSKELEDLDLSSNQKPKDETFRDKHLKTPRNFSPRRSVNHRRQVSVGADDQNPAFQSPTIATPTYMAATESAKAKARSLSSPRVRPGSFDTQSESYSPYKNKLSLTSSLMSDAPNRVRVNNNNNVNRQSAYHQRSPGLRGFNTGPVKSSHMTLNDLSINSERSLPSWNRQSSFR